MKSLKYIVSILLLATALGKALACGGWGDYDPRYHYFFYLGYTDCYDQNSDYEKWHQRTQQQFRNENINFWHRYVNKAVSLKDVEKAIYSGNMPSKKEPFYNYLYKKNDTAAIQYWKVVNDDNNHVQWLMSGWYYPTKKEAMALQSGGNVAAFGGIDLNTIAECKNPNLRNRYTLQLMRRAFYMEKYGLCIEVWKKYGSHIPTSALRTQCKSYYAGALYHTGKETASAVAFAEIGVCQNWFTYNTHILKDIYNNQPNSKSLEFIVQHLVNKHFDEKFGTRYTVPKASRYNLKKHSDDFNHLANYILADNRSNNPAMWKSAQAAFAYIDGDKQLAPNLIQQADSLKGTPNVKNNIRLMSLLFHAADTTAGDDYETNLLPDLKHLVNLVKKDVKKLHYNNYDIDGYSIYTDPYYEAEEALNRIKILRRTVLVEIADHFKKPGQNERLLAYLNIYSEITGQRHKPKDIAMPKNYKTEYYRNNEYYSRYYGRIIRREISRTDYFTHFFNFADTTSIENLKKHINFLKSGGETEMDKLLIGNSYHDYNYLYELLGTKYLRIEQWDSAITYLQQVPTKFLITQNIYPYIENRNPFNEDWITNKRRGKYSLTQSPTKAYHKKTTKLQFCRIMKQLQWDMDSASSAKQRAGSRYAYAVAMYQAMCGKCWALTEYYHSDWDKQTTLQRNTLKTTRTLADKAIATTSNPDIRNKSLLLKYITLGHLAETAVPISYEWSYEKIERQISKREKYLDKLVVTLLRQWSRIAGNTVNSSYIQKNFCDDITDYSYRQPSKQTAMK